MATAVRIAQQRRSFGGVLVALVLRLRLRIGDARHDHLALADRTEAPVLGQPRVDAFQMVSVTACGTRKEG